MKKAVFLVQCLCHAHRAPMLTTEYFVIKIPAEYLLKNDTINFQDRVNAAMPDYMQVAVKRVEVQQVHYLFTE